MEAIIGDMKITKGCKHKDSSFHAAEDFPKNSYRAPKSQVKMSTGKAMKSHKTGREPWWRGFQVEPF